MAYARVLYRIDAPHIFYGWNPVLAKRTDVLKEGMLDTETRVIHDKIPEKEILKTSPLPKPKPKPQPQPKSRRQAPAKKQVGVRGKPGRPPTAPTAPTAPTSLAEEAEQALSELR